MTTTDTLFVACTRPATKFGVPFDGLRVNAFLTLFITTVMIRQPPGLLIGVAIHMGMRELCRIDPHFFHKWKLYAQTKMISGNAHLWGGSRLDPSPNQISNAIEVRSSL